MSASAVAQAKPYAARTEVAVEQKSVAIWWWAALGLFCTALQIWVFWRWYASGDMHPTDTGVTPIPGWMSLFLKLDDVFWTSLILLTLYYQIVKPLLKTRRLTFEAIFILAFTTIWWQDPLYSYVNLAFAYNSHSLNLGSWACHIPGWLTPGGCNIAEPLTIDFAYYFTLCTVPVFWASRKMHAIKARYPNIRTSTLFLGWAAMIALIDLVFETSCIALGIWHYGGVPDDMSIFTGTRFKFPLFEPVFVGLSFAGYAAIYYFRNDKGETLAERGLDQVNATPAARQWLRFFALSGAANSAIFLGFTVPVVIFTLQADAWPKGVQELSWMTNRICGEGTLYACGGKNVALGRIGQAINVGPDGQLTMPAGTAVPQLVPLKRTAD